MIKTYTRTMMIENLAEAKVKVILFENNKYTSKDLGKEIEVKYTGLKSWSIVNGEDANEIESETDGSCIDEFHEYLVLDFVDGSKATFRNSHCDMFIR